METMNEISVKTEGLTKKFGDFTAVDSVSFQVRKGEIFGFLGANGAGKTTCIRMLCGILMPTSGKGWVEDIDIVRHPKKVKNVIGYMSQKFSLYLDLTVEENLRFYGGIYGLKGKKLRGRMEEMIEMVDLKTQRKTITGSLPLGWKQKLAFACSIIHSPQALFLDEPTSGVDPISRRIFWDMIHETAERGASVFVTTHYMDEAEYCNRLSIMHQGRIIAMDAPGSLKDQYDEKRMEDVFIRLIEQEIRNNRKTEEKNV